MQNLENKESYFKQRASRIFFGGGSSVSKLLLLLKAVWNLLQWYHRVIRKTASLPAEKKAVSIDKIKAAQRCALSAGESDLPNYNENVSGITRFPPV